MSPAPVVSTTSVDGGRTLVMLPAGSAVERSGGPECNDYGSTRSPSDVQSLVRHSEGGTIRERVRIGKQPHKDVEFSRIGSHDWTVVKQLQHRRVRWRRIEHARHAGRACCSNCRGDGIAGDLGADEHAADSRAENVAHPSGHPIGPNLGVRSGSDGDLVLARLVDNDQRDARADACVYGDPADVDAHVPQILQRDVRHAVVSDGPDQRDPSPRSRSCEGGVRPFAAGMLERAAADDGLPWLRERGC